MGGPGSGIRLGELERKHRHRCLTAFIAGIKNVKGNNPALIRWYKLNTGCGRSTLRGDLADLTDKGMLSRTSVLGGTFRYVVSQQ